MSKCYCQTALTFEVSRGTVTCWCQRCKAKAAADDEGWTSFVYGHGKTNETAAADWHDAMRRF